jgi:hypothetical protein
MVQGIAKHAADGMMPPPWSSSEGLFPHFLQLHPGTTSVQQQLMNL